MNAQMKRKCFELDMWSLYRARHEEEIMQARRSIEELKQKEQKCRLQLFHDHYGNDESPLGVLQALETRIWECFDRDGVSLQPPQSIVLKDVGEILQELEKFLIPTQKELDAYWCLYGTSMTPDKEK